mgnify:CR=1 FL=1
MKITKVKATPIIVPYNPIKTESKMSTGLKVTDAIIVEVHTDEGIIGFGETPPVLGCDLSASIVQSTEDVLIGEDPTNINKILKQLYVRYNGSHFHIHTISWAFSGIDMALWDIAGKRAGMPLYQLWGGAYRKRIEFIGSVERQTDLDEMSKEAEQCAAEGFKTIYTKIGMDPDEDIAAVAALRRGAPSNKIKIRIDANQAWSTGQAILQINKMEPYGLEFVEQPVIMYNLDALRTVRDRVSVPISAHEASWTIYDLMNLIKADCVDYARIDARFDAGYGAALTAAGMCEAAGIQLTHHAFNSELSLAMGAKLHLMASCPNFTMASGIQPNYVRLKDDVIKGGPLKMEGPYIKVPEGPGIGMELDYDKLQFYNEYYIKEMRDKKLDRKIRNQNYAAMHYRPYLNDI